MNEEDPTAQDLAVLGFRSRETVLFNALKICNMVMTDEQKAKVRRNLQGFAAINSIDIERIIDTADTTAKKQRGEVQEAATMRAHSEVLKIFV